MAPLSKEEKLRKLELIQERKRRLRRAKSVYVPNKGQLAVHKDRSTIRLVQSGNGGGKTALGANEAIWAATGWNPITEQTTKVPAKIVILLDSPEKVTDVWLPELKKWYNVDEECEQHKHGKPYVNELVFKNGSRIIFLTHLMEPLRFEGMELDYLIADEPFPRPIWVALTRGARTKGSKPRFLLVGTPLGQPWMTEQLWNAAQKGERTDIGCHRYSTAVNEKNLAEGYIEQFSKNLTEKEKQARLEGRPAHLDGLALAHLFKREQHIVDPFEWPRGKPVVIAIDPHYNKPTTALMVGATGDGRIYVIKEFKSTSTPRIMSTELKAWMDGYRVLEIVVDSLGNTPMSGGDGNRSFIEVMNANGVRCRATSYEDKSDEEWIHRIRDVLAIPDEHDNWGRKIPKLAVVSTCTGLITDIENVTWLKYKGLDEWKPRLDISNKDHLSCLKYALACNIDYLATGKAPKIKRAGKSPWSGTAR